MTARNSRCFGVLFSESFNVIFVMAVFYFLGGSYCAASPIVALVPGTTREEYVELQEGGDYASDCLWERERALDTILRAHPLNRAALLLRAQAAVQLGDTLVAGSDLARLGSLDPKFAGLTSTRVSLARVRGATREELDAYATMGSPEKEGWSARARVAELQGDLPQAIAEVKTSIARHDGAFSYVELAELQLRHKEPEAIKSLETAIAQMQADAFHKSASPWVQAELMGAYWADGRREKALEVGLDLSRKIIGDDDHHSVRTCLPRALLGCVVLTDAGVGTARDSAEVQRILEQSLKLTDKPHAEMEEFTFLAISGKRDREQASQGARLTLKRAPYLEWAQWSALYLILTQDRDAQGLSDALPLDSLQHRIAVAEFAFRADRKRGDRKRGRKPF